MRIISLSIGMFVLSGVAVMIGVEDLVFFGPAVMFFGLALVALATAVVERLER